MKALWAAAMAIGLLGATGLPRAAAPAATPQVVTFKSGVDLVSFAVTVTDRKGEFVTNLAEPDFEVYEDGVRQTLKFFTAGGSATSPIGPLHLGVLFDISGSMDEDMRMSRTAAIKFLKTLDDADDMTLVDFDTEIRLARYAPSDFPSLVERIRSRKAEGFTALYDAVAVYLRSASTVDGRKILVFYTDGGDNDSSLTLGDILTLLKASDVTVYTIGFLQHVGSAAMELRSRLERMAEITGGQSFAPLSIKDLDGVYEKVRAEIRAQYAMGYVSTNTKQDGTWRKVEIKVLRGGRDVKIRTRKGYFAPYKTATAR